MVDYNAIRNTLNKLENAYNLAIDPQDQALYSKLSVMELCGWLEVSLDEILKGYVSNHILDTKLSNEINKIIDRNYGFDYDKNIFPLFCSVLGINNVENLLDYLPIADYLQFKSVVGNYVRIRNTAAHTDTPMGTTRSYYAPSIVLGDYGKIMPAIKRIETFVGKL